MVKTKLDGMALRTAEARRDWAIAKSKSLAKRRMEIASGAPRAMGVPLKDAIARYYRAHPHLSPRSVLDYGLATDKLFSWATRVNIRVADDLTRAKLMEFRETLIREPKKVTVKGAKRGARGSSLSRRAPHSVNGELRKVRTVLGYLRKIDLLPRLTNDDLKDGCQALAVNQERIAYLPAERCQQLMTAALAHDAVVFAETREEHAGLRTRGTTARHTSIAPFVAFVLLTGMRFGEALEIKWEQIDLTARDDDGHEVGEIHLLASGTKTKRARTVGLDVSPALRGILLMLFESSCGTGRVFSFTEGVAEAAARRLRDSFDAPANFSWQMLRRTCGTYLTNAPGIFGAASAYRSAKQLGHSVLVAEKHYLGLVRGIPRTARSLEAALQIESQLQCITHHARSAVEPVDDGKGLQTAAS
ncbi:MAG TPA: hypothetical protein VFX59_15705 [Polyangiales bacterium]|nr:hypothetical protein [Polyangiales bacterium]